MNVRRILFVIAHPPHRGSLALEVLDELLVGAAFDQKISVLFIGDGVFQLLDTPAAPQSESRGYRALPTYDVENVYVEQRAMQLHNLSVDSFVTPARVLSRRRIQTLVATQDVVIPD